MWALSLSQLPASLFEEAKAVVTPLLLMHHTGNGHRAALGAAHIYLLELALACCAARLCSRRQVFHYGRWLLLAGALNLAGLVAMSLGTGSGAFALRVCVGGHVLCALGATVRDSVFPLLATCFPEEHISQMNAHRHVFVHAGALLGGMMIAIGMMRLYLLLQVGAMLVSLGLVARALPCLSVIDCDPVHGKASAKLSARGDFGLLVAARFFQSWGFVSTSGAVMLVFLKSRISPDDLGTWTAAGLVASAGVAGHVAGLLVNLVLGRQRMHYGRCHILGSTLVYALALLGYSEFVGAPRQFLLITVLLRGARTLGKAASDALTLRTAKYLGSGKAAALVARKGAFKLGQLVGKYSIIPLLAMGDEDASFRMVFSAGVLASLLGAALQLCASSLAESAGCAPRQLDP